MKNLRKLAVASAVASAVTMGLSGCGGSSSSSSSFSAYQRLDSLAAQTATISIADPAGTPVVTIVSQPADITLAGTATAVSGTNTTLSLSATNNTGRLLFGAKAVVNSVSDSTATNAVTVSASGTTNDTSEEFASFGFKAIADGASADAVDAMSFTDLDGLDDPLVIEVTLPTEEVMAYGSDSASGGTEYQIQDVNGALELNDVDIANYANATPGDGGTIDGVTSPDGRYIYYAGRNSVHLMYLDTTTLQTGIIELQSDQNIGNVGGVAMSSNGQYLYVAHSLGSHRYCYNYGAETTHYLTKVNLSNHTVVKTMKLSSIAGGNYYTTSLKQIALSGDGNTVAIVTANSCGSSGESTLVVADANLSSETALATAEYMRYVALDEDGSTAYLVADRGSNVYTVDTATGERGSFASGNTSTSSARGLDFGPDGRLYWLRSTSTDGLAIFDLSGATPAETLVDTVGTPEGMTFDLDGDKYYINESSGTSTWDITTDTVTQAASGLSSIAKHGYVTSAY